ncbi:MAG: SGNH/GDSL hydrolase family protein [Verrucomicrobiales bacterium]|nr:SGNH/GDSL hydrolase family protein [Verrucomicrobiales bacterium]
MKFPIIVLSILFGVYSVFGEEHKNRVVLPATVYAVPGVPVSIVFRNAVLLAPGESMGFRDVASPVGSVSRDGSSWSFVPDDSQVGDHTITIAGKDVVVKVVPRNAGGGRDISLLIVGDSLTNATHYPNEIAALLNAPANPGWKLLGTHAPTRAKPGVRHEGYGGWTWSRFLTRWEPKAEQSGKSKSSPFLFPANGSDPVLDFERYFHTYCEGQKPDFVTVLLGINDCFHANPDDPSAIENKIDTMLDSADRFIAAMRTASPETEIGICLTPAANDRDEAFYANYKNRYTRWGWRRIQFRLVERQMEHFGNRESENVYIIPTSVGIDPLTGYPPDNGGHPNEKGYQTLGREIYCWLKWRLAER